jgi:hypothetical protein
MARTDLSLQGTWNPRAKQSGEKLEDGCSEDLNAFSVLLRDLEGAPRKEEGRVLDELFRNGLPRANQLSKGGRRDEQSLDSLHVLRGVFPNGFRRGI